MEWKVRRGRGAEGGPQLDMSGAQDDTHEEAQRNAKGSRSREWTADEKVV